MTKAELRRRMTARELREWKAYYDAEPWGGARGDLQAMAVAAAATAPYAKAGARHPAVADFLPSLWDPPESPETDQPQGIAEQIASLRLLAQVLKGK